MTTVKGHMGSVEFDGATVTIEKSMRGRQTIPLEHVTSVGIVNAGVGMRAIRFSVAGGSTAGRSMALGSHRDLANDPYALTFRKKRVGEFEEFAQAVLAARAAS